MKAPEQKRGFALFGHAQTYDIWFECVVPDIIADIQTKCDEGMGILFRPGEAAPRHYVLKPSALYDFDEVLEWLKSFETD